MKIKFYKYQGAGNDFVMIDDRQKNLKLSTANINFLCDRHFGIGADGLIVLQNDEIADFKMIYYNSDGNESTMCGNGGRCLAQFAHDLSVKTNEMNFNAIDGLHQAKILPNQVALQMIDVEKVENFEHYQFLNTGSPHHISFQKNIDALDVKTLGREIRYGAPYFEEGSNVNFVEISGANQLKIRTYERGVEDETLACGTGVTAAAIAAYEKGVVNELPIKVKALGGDLEVNFEKRNDTYQNVWLTGPAKFVFEGTIEIN